MLFFILILIIAAAAALARQIRIVPHQMTYVIERFGKYYDTWEDGLHVKMPIADRIVKKVSKKERVYDFPPQDVITKDNVTISIDSVVYASVFDPQSYTYSIDNPILGLQNLTATTLRSIIGSMELDQTLSSRSEINQHMRTVLDEATDGWGIRVSRVEVKNIKPPAEIEEVMTTKKITSKYIKDKYGKNQLVLEATDVSDPKEVEKLQDKIETSLCLTNYKTFKLGGTKTLKSILISAAVRLNPFSIPAIKNLTDDDNVELESVGDRLTCFFAIIPQTNSTFNFLISMLFSQMFESLYYKGATIPNSRLNYHVRFLLDEFANIGKIPEFPQKISTCRKYNISTTIVLQSIAQIKMLYKDDYETIIGNCDTSICLGTNEQTTAEYFSKKLGVGTITTKSSSFQVGKQGGTTSRQQTKRELMLPDEIMTMPFNKCIVMMRGIDPFYDNKYPLENHPQFMNTGDGDKKNFYFLEKDPEFLCVDKTEEYTDDAVADNIDDSPEKLKPKTLEEVLGDLLLNIPEEDGYYLIKDADRSPSEIKKSMFRSIKKDFEEKIEEAIEKQDKTAFFDGKEMDVSMLRGMAVKAMRSYGEFINDVAIACDGLSGSGHLCCTAAKDDDCNVVKVMKNMNLQSENKTKDSITDFKVYKIKEELSEDKFDKFKKGCQLGAGTVASAKAVEAEDIDFDDYA